MEGVREYLLSVTAGAMLCAIVTGLTGEKGALSGLQRLVCGLFLCFTAIAPLTEVNISDFSDLALDILNEGREIAREGEESSRAALRQIISDETRAYIMDKARSYGAEVEVQISLSRDDPPVPVGCIITGRLSPYVRQQLTKVLISELGIPEENLTWTQ